MSQRTYLNPVYGSSFADPYVLKHRGRYWAYCTGEWKDGWCFGVLYSRDLVTWAEIGGAMKPLPGDYTCYWAPEVVYEGGRFLMYYSVGNHDFMHVRVATSDAPDGPFVDAGVRLTSEDFAIDPHVFAGSDGSRHLFYATDFLEHAFVGTGTVRDRLVTPFALEGSPRPVTRAKYDWQVFDPARAEKGGVRWHTVEGPFVLERKGRYYEMFSGGNWTNPSYGASYAVADAVDAEGEWEQIADGVVVPPVLRTIPGRVVGPGHNSVVRGPDNRQPFCVYHRWEDDRRVMAIDRLDWVGERLTVLGPSADPQPAPNPATVSGFAPKGAAAALAPEWTVDGGHWAQHDGSAVQRSTDGSAALARVTGCGSFLVEASVRLDAEAEGSAGLAASDGLGRRLSFAVRRRSPFVSVSAPWLQGGAPVRLDPVGPFATDAFHLLRLEVDGRRARFVLDGGAARWACELPAPAESVSLRTEGAAATFDGFELTLGWDDLFETDGTPHDVGWTPSAEGDWVIAGGALRQRDETAPRATVTKRVPGGPYELVVNARLDTASPGASYGFLLASSPEGTGMRVGVEADGDGWALVVDGAATRRVPLGQDFDPANFQQFRFRACGGSLTVHRERDLVGVFEAPRGGTHVGLYASEARASFEAVRMTRLPEEG